MAAEWPETLELTIDAMAQGGDGVGRWQGRVVFAEGGLPGEQVLVRLRERREAYARGAVAQVLAAAPERIAPRDPQADHMPWQHIEHAAQLRFKRQILAEQLAKIGGLADAPLAEIVPASQPWGYRSSARLHVRGGRLGYFRAGTRELRPFAGDPLLLPSLGRALEALADLIDEDDGVEEVTLRASEANGYAVAALRGRGDLRPLARLWMQRAPQVAGASLPNGAVGNVELSEEVGGISFLLRPESFFQVNSAAAEVLLQLVRQGLDMQGGERLIDLYCGVGTFALPLAGRASAVIGIEEAEVAVRDAERSAEANGVANVRFFAGTAERLLSTVKEQADALVLDPPRRGCHPQALAQVLRIAPARVVYVSCHPGTLARDLKTLVEGGYRVEQVTPVDLFPQTPHIESVTVLTRA